MEEGGETMVLGEEGIRAGEIVEGGASLEGGKMRMQRALDRQAALFERGVAKMALPPPVRTMEYRPV